MKKLIYIFLLLLSLITAFANSQNEINLQLNLPKGFSASVIITSEFDSLNKAMLGVGDVKDYNKTVERYQINCLDVDAEGNMQVRQTWKSIREVYRDLNGEICVRYDSEDSRYPVPDSAVFEKYTLGQSLVFKVSPKGEILDISGYEKIADKLTKPALKYLHLEKDGIIRRLKNQDLFGIPEFCSDDIVKVGELHTETTIPNINSIPKIVSYSKKWSIKEIDNRLVHYEIVTDTVKKQTRDIIDFEGKRTDKLYTEEKGVRHLYCDVVTGFIMKSQHTINSASRDIYGGYDQSKTLREYSSNGTITIETMKNETKASLMSERGKLIFVIGIVILVGIIVFGVYTIKGKNGKKTLYH